MLYERLCDPSFLYESWRAVERKKGASGVDGQSVRDFSNHLERNLLLLSKHLQNESYEPSALRHVKIKKDNGRFRRLGIPTIADRIVFQGIHRLLLEVWDPHFAPFSFAYRPNHGITSAIEALIQLLSQGRFWFVKGDVRGCFDEINWTVLSSQLRDWVQDESLRRLINKALRVPVVEEGRIRQRCKGLPQGSPLSPILSNLYLHPLDMEMFNNGYPLIRYADDWVVLVESEEGATDAFYLAQSALSLLCIELNPQKSGIGDLQEESILFLGHRIDSLRVDAGPNGWRRFADALSTLKTARGNQEMIQAKGQLAQICSLYRHSGRIDRGDRQ